MREKKAKRKSGGGKGQAVFQFDYEFVEDEEQTEQLSAQAPTAPPSLPDTRRRGEPVPEKVPPLLPNLEVSSPTASPSIFAESSTRAEKDKSKEVPVFVPSSKQVKSAAEEQDQSQIEKSRLPREIKAIAAKPVLALPAAQTLDEAGEQEEDSVSAREPILPTGETKKSSWWRLRPPRSRRVRSVKEEDALLADAGQDKASSRQRKRAQKRERVAEKRSLEETAPFVVIAPLKQKKVIVIAPSKSTSEDSSTAPAPSIDSKPSKKNASGPTANKKTKVKTPEVALGANGEGDDEGSGASGRSRLLKFLRYKRSHAAKKPSSVMPAGSEEPVNPLHESVLPLGPIAPAAPARPLVVDTSEVLVGQVGPEIPPPSLMVPETPMADEAEVVVAKKASVFGRLAFWRWGRKSAAAEELLAVEPPIFNSTRSTDDAENKPEPERGRFGLGTRRQPVNEGEKTNVQIVKPVRSEFGPVAPSAPQTALRPPASKPEATALGSDVSPKLRSRLLAALGFGTVDDQRPQPEKAKKVKPEKAKKVKPEKAKKVKPEKAKRVKPEKAKRVKPEKAKRVKPEKAKRVKPEKAKRFWPQKKGRLEGLAAPDGAQFIEGGEADALRSAGPMASGAPEAAVQRKDIERARHQSVGKRIREALGLSPQEKADTPAPLLSPVEERLLVTQIKEQRREKKWPWSKGQTAEDTPKRSTLVVAAKKPSKRVVIARALGLGSRQVQRAPEFTGGHKSAKDVPLEGFARIDVDHAPAQRIFPAATPRPTRSWRERMFSPPPNAPVAKADASRLNKALAVVGFARQPLAEDLTGGRIIRLDEPSPAVPPVISSAWEQPDDAQPQVEPPSPAGNQTLRERASGVLPESVRTRARAPVRALAMAWPLLVAPLIALAVILLAKHLHTAFQFTPLIDALLMVLAEAAGVLVSVSYYNRERSPRDQLTWRSARRILSELAYGSNGEPSIAFLGGLNDRSEHMPLWQRVALWLLPKHEVYGLDIGSSHLRAALVRDGAIVSVVSRPIPRGILVDGILWEVEALAVELRALWEQAGFSSKEVNFSISNRQVALKTLSLAAAADERDMELAIVMNAETVLRPMNTETSIIDFAELSRSGTRVSVQLAAAEKEMVQNFVKAVQGAGLTCISCELGPLAGGRSLIISRNVGVAHGVVDIGAEKTTFIYASGADIFFLRVVEIGGNDFTQAISQAVGCSWEEAELLKLRSGLGLVPVDSELDRELFARCQQALQPIADRLTQELSGTPRLFQEGQEGRPMAGLTLLGGGARLAGLAEQIAMFMRVESLTPPTARPGVEIGEEFSAYATAIGLALGHRMSLLPATKGRSFSLDLPGRRRKPKLETERAKRQAKRLRSGRGPSIISSTSIAMIMMVFVIGGSFFYSNHLKSQSASLQIQLLQNHTPTNSSPILVPPVYKGLRAGSSADSVAVILAEQPDYSTVSAALAALVRAQFTFKSATASGDTITIVGANTGTPSSTVLRSDLSNLPLTNLVVTSSSNQITITFAAPTWRGR